MRPKRYEDGFPFVGIPINPEQSIREYVTFKEIENMCNVNTFDFSNIYYFAIKYENANNESNRVRNLYEFKLNYANSIHRDVLDRAKKLFRIDYERNIKPIKNDEKERLDNEFKYYLNRTNRIEVEVKLISDVKKLKNCDCKF